LAEKYARELGDGSQAFTTQLKIITGKGRQSTFLPV